jgi:hypothetical protein
MLLESTVTLQILVLKPCKSLSEKNIIYAQHPSMPANCSFSNYEYGLLLGSVI